MQIVADRFVTLLDRFERRKLALDAAIDSCLILRPDQQQGVCSSAVTTCTTRLLIVLLERLAHRIVDNKTHVSLVDTHTERIGSHHYTCAAIAPRRLAHRAVGVTQTTVIVVGRNAVLVQELGQLLGALARTHIYNARAADLLDHTQNLLVLVVNVAHHVLQIGTRETAAQDIRLAKTQFVHHVLCNQIGR